MRLLPTAILLLALAFSPALAAEAQLATPNADGITYGHVHLNVADIEVHKKLWVEYFDGVVVEKGPLTAIRLPNFLIALTERDPSGPMQGSVLDHFGFKVRNTADFLARWRAAGMEVGPEFIGAEGMPNAYVAGARRRLGRAAGRPVAARPDRRLPHPLHHAGLRGAAGVVRKGVLARRPPPRAHRDDDRRARHEHELRGRRGGDRADPRAGARPHRLRGRRPGGLLPEARGDGHRVRRGSTARWRASS